MRGCSMLSARKCLSQRGDIYAHVLYHLGTTSGPQISWCLIRSMIHETNAGDRRAVINLQDKNGHLGCTSHMSYWGRGLQQHGRGSNANLVTK